MLARVYWPAWGRASRAAWESDRGAVLPRSLREEPADPGLPSAAQIERIAERLRGPTRLTLDHLRHASHVLALGKDKSATALSPGEIDRCVALWDLIADPLSLDAVNRWLDPDLDARRRLEWRLSRHPMGADYVAAIARDRFGAASISTLSARDLRHLLMTVDQRSRAAARRYNHRAA